MFSQPPIWSNTSGIHPVGFKSGHFSPLAPLSRHHSVPNYNDLSIINIESKQVLYFRTERYQGLGWSHYCLRHEKDDIVFPILSIEARPRGRALINGTESCNPGDESPQPVANCDYYW